MISSLALDYMREGIKFNQNKEFNNAARYFSISWAFNALQEYPEGMDICDRLLETLKVPHDNLTYCHEYGRETVNKVMSMVESVERRLHNTSVDKKERSLKAIVDSI